MSLLGVRRRPVLLSAVVMVSILPAGWPGVASAAGHRAPG
jgi:hypothetical protein